MSRSFVVRNLPKPPKWRGGLLKTWAGFRGVSIFFFGRGKTGFHFGHGSYDQKKFSPCSKDESGQFFATIPNLEFRAPFWEDGTP